MWLVTGKADTQVIGSVAQTPKGIPSLIVSGNTHTGISEYHRSPSHRHTSTVSDPAGDHVPLALRTDCLYLALWTNHLSLVPP